MRTAIVIFMVLCTASVVPAQIGAKTQQAASIYGVWHNSQFGYEMTLILNQDGSGEFDGEAITFKQQGNNLTILLSGTATSYNYTQQGSSLTLSGGDLQGEVVFARNGAIDNSVSTTTSKISPDASTSSSIVGTWSGSGETIEFRGDGKCVYLANTFDYQLGQDTVTLVTNQGNAIFKYSIRGNRLTLSGAKGDATYTRGTAAMGDSKRQVAMDLVGQWQWTTVSNYNQGASESEKYIVLKADGTYTYHSSSSRSVNTTDLAGGTNSLGDDDAGTWWVQGDRIFYNSYTKGQGSYSLQKRNHPKTNDPMIVIDGQPYVTSIQRAPWR